MYYRKVFAIAQELPVMHVAVIGSGIIGCASAYYLRKQGVDVTVFERDKIGAGATPRAGGGIREQFSTSESIALSRISIEVWKTFEENFDVNIGYRQPGYLYLARNEKTAANFRRTVKVQNHNSVPSEYLTPEEAAEHCPNINPERYVGATYCATGGFANTEPALQGFALAAARNGARFRIGRPVTDITQKGDTFDVHTDINSTEADYIVNAAGAWAPHIGKMVGLDLSFESERHQLAVVDLAEPVDKDIPFTFDHDNGSYFRQWDAGTMMIGGAFSETEIVDSDEYNPDNDDDWAETALAAARDMSGFFEGASVRRGWAGLYSRSPDNHPVIEETIPGFVNACGFSGHGFMQSPATGQLVSEIIVDGKASLIDISRLTADRFEEGEELYETFHSA